MYICKSVVISLGTIEVGAITLCENYRDFTLIRGVSCNTYLFCFLGKPFRQGWCYLGTGFDPILKRCTWQAFIQCEKEVQEKQNQLNNIFVCPGSLSEAFYPNYTGGCPTKKYLQCNNGVLTKKTCNTGMFYNDGIDSCDSYTKIPCDVRNALCPQDLIHGIYADYSSGCPPNKYFVCLGYFDEAAQTTFTYKSEYTCPDGLYYNEGIKSCDFIQNIPCQHNIKN
ncbi:hypothetical protein SNE40_003368 [Patella caerulea]|uniref:Chitin-binding type-2 domain-containing protein n=1 Tax=Patella caerulea TaxID=87958 RepID=A0AAN8K7U3_PATCE